MSLPIPKRRMRQGETYTITMMDLRHNPGEVFDAVWDGAVVHVTRQGKHVATIVPPELADVTIKISPDGKADHPSFFRVK